MTAGLFAALLLAATPPADPLGARIADSARAAQALQGRWDGAWVLRDVRGRALLMLQIVDPVGGGAPAAAWREPGDGGAAGYVDEIARTAGGLTLVFTRPGAGQATRIRLHADGGGASGSLSEGATVRRVRLVRDGAHGYTGEP